jgi:hypothetical protein
MESDKTADVKMQVCNACEQRLSAAAHAMRRHATQVLQAIEIGRKNPADDVRQQQRALIYASFKETQAAWNAYRDHLVEHGLLTSDES